MARFNSKLTTDNIYVGEGTTLLVSSNMHDWVPKMSTCQECQRIYSYPVKLVHGIPLSPKVSNLERCPSREANTWIINQQGLKGLSRESSLSDTAKPK